MHSPAHIFSQLLIDLGHASESGAWPVFVGFAPDDPDNRICVYDSDGKEDGRYMRSGEKVEHPGVDIDIFGTDQEELWAKANEIKDALDAVRNVSIEISAESYNILNVSRVGNLIDVGMQDKGDRRTHKIEAHVNLTIE
jgi:hypothetical protein